MVIVDIDKLAGFLPLFEVDRLDHIWVALQRRVLDVQHCNHWFTKDCVLLGCHEVECYLEVLLLAHLRDLDLYLDVHQPSALDDLLELVLAVRSIGESVVAPNHRR